MSEFITVGDYVIITSFGEGYYQWLEMEKKMGLEKHFEDYPKGCLHYTQADLLTEVERTGIVIAKELHTLINNYYVYAVKFPCGHISLIGEDGLELHRKSYLPDELFEI